MSEQDLQLRLRRGFAPVEDSIASGRIPGAVLGITDREGRTATLCAGSAQLVPVRRAISRDTWFDLASLTKVIFTTPRILALASEGVICLDDPLTTVLPDLRQYDAGCWERKITFRQCLGHQTALPAVFPIYTYGRDAELLRAFVLQHEWMKNPREKSPVYSDINFILLGLALERLAGKRIWQMQPPPGFSFGADPARCAATENCTWRNRVLCGEVHDDNCAALQGAGHAGLFGTAGSVLKFASKLFGESTMPNTTGSESSLASIRSPMSDTRTLGWERAHTGWSGGQHCSESTIGHTGFTGTGLWVDFESGLAWSLLTNRIHPTRHMDSGIVELRQQVSDLICAGAGCPGSRQG